MAHYTLSDPTLLVFNMNKLDSRYLNVNGGDTVTGPILIDLATDSVGITIQGDAAQSANLQEWEDSAGTDLAYITNDGDLYVGGTVGIGVAPNDNNILYVRKDAFDIQAGGRWGIHAEIYLKPAGALSNTTVIHGGIFQALWDSTVTGATHGYIWGAEGTAYIRDEALNTATGLYGRARHQGSDTVTSGIGVRGDVNNDDANGETGDITSGYSFLATAVTDKSTGVIGSRYGLYIEDVTGGGKVTNQYGIYCPALSAADTDNLFIKNVSAASDFGSGDIDTTGDVTVGTLDVSGHSAFGSDPVCVPAATRIAWFREISTEVDTSRYGIHSDYYWSPSGALGSTSSHYGVLVDSVWKTAEDGSTYGYLYGAKSRALIDFTSDGALLIATGVLGVGDNRGTGTITTLIGVQGDIRSDDDGGEDGDVTSAYSFLATGFTSKGTGTITDRYGLYIEDVTGGGNLTNQYGIYCPALTGASGNNLFIKNVSAASDFGSGNITTTGIIYIDSDTNGLTLGDDADVILYSDTADELSIKGLSGATADIKLLFESGNEGSITWMEDEKYFTVDADSDASCLHLVGADAGNDYADIYVNEDGDLILMPISRTVDLGDGTAGDSTFRFYGATSLFTLVHDDSEGDLSLSANDATNKMVVEDDGTARFEGTATVWKDINLGAAQLSRPASSQPDEDNFEDENGNDTGITTLAYDVGEKASGSFEIQHDYKEGSNFTFHIHWQGIAAPSGTDNVQWRLTYVLMRDGTTLDGVTTIDSPDTSIDTRYKCYRSDFAAIDGSTAGNNGGGVKIGDQFLFTIERVAATGDAYAGDALVATMGLHYEIDTIGSREIVTK